MVIKLVVNESSEKRNSRQLFPTPAFIDDIVIAIKKTWRPCDRYLVNENKREVAKEFDNRKLEAKLLQV